MRISLNLRFTGVFLLLTVVFPVLLQAAPAEKPRIKWRSWSDEVFQEAKKEKKLILLNLEAVWCHWCHVMQEKTYGDKDVARVVNAGFIPIKADQDAHPDLSIRYREYGWPATIILNSGGAELSKLSGYIEAAKMLQSLENAQKNPDQAQKTGDIEVDIKIEGQLSPEYRNELIQKHDKSLDTELGGLRTNHKYLDFETMEYALMGAAKGSEPDTAFVKLSLKSNLKLIDPVWGGVYQYSTGRNWNSPHFEKIVSSQSDNMRLYAHAYSVWGEENSWNTATAIYSYLKSFLTSPEGAFYASQDADLKKGEHSADYFKLDDTARRKRGIPAVDKNIYSRENGLIISALTTLYAATGNRAFADDAVRSAEWIIKHRSLPGGGFRHGEKDKGGPFLTDSLAMAEAFLNLYAATAERKWLKKAEETAIFIRENFADKFQAKLLPGFFSFRTSGKTPLKPVKNLAENVRLTRFMNLLGHYTGEAAYAELARLAMSYIAVPAHGSGMINDSGILIADHEMSQAPLHITIVGHKDDPQSKILFQAGLKFYSAYKRIEWWDKREGPMPNPDVEYPQLAKPAAFICTNKRCSLPIFKPGVIAETIKLFHKD